MFSKNELVKSYCNILTESAVLYNKKVMDETYKEMLHKLENDIPSMSFELVEDFPNAQIEKWVAGKTQEYNNKSVELTMSYQLPEENYPYYSIIIKSANIDDETGDHNYIGTSVYTLYKYDPDHKVEPKDERFYCDIDTLITDTNYQISKLKEGSDK